MELNMTKVLFLVFALLTFSSGVLATEPETELSFFQTLSAQEDKEHQDLIDQIKNMSRGQYKQFLQSRIDEGYEGKAGNLSAFVIVDVTSEMNQPEATFFENLFSTRPEEKEYGINKIKALLKEDANNGGVGQPSGLKLDYQYQNHDKKRYFQRVDGFFNKASAISLVRKNEVIDLHVTDPRYPAWSAMTSYDLHTGRVLPPKIQKVYNDEFIVAGIYSDLMKRFDKKKVVLIRIDFFQPNNYINSVYTVEEHNAQTMEVDDFLSEWNGFNFELIAKGTFHIYMQTTKAHVEAMKNHKMVDSISIGDSFLIGAHHSD